MVTDMKRIAIASLLAALMVLATGCGASDTPTSSGTTAPSPTTEPSPTFVDNATTDPSPSSTPTGRDEERFFQAFADAGEPVPMAKHDDFFAAGTAVCASLDLGRGPRRSMAALALSGFEMYDVGQISGAAVQTLCPEHKQALMDFFKELGFGD